jgi:hypothetical protein
LVQTVAALKVKASSLDEDIKDEDKDQKGIDDKGHRFQVGNFLGNSLGEEDVEGELSQNAQQDQKSEAETVDVELGMGVIFWPNLEKGRKEPDCEKEEGCWNCKPQDLILADGIRPHQLIRYYDPRRKYRKLQVN